MPGFEEQMHSYRMPPIERVRQADPLLVGIIICLLLIGLVMVHSSSAYLALDEHKNQLYYIRKQLIFAALGCIVMYGLSRLNYANYRKLIYPALPMLFAALVGVFFMSASKGATRWIKFTDFSIQPSEFVKVGLVIYLAHSLTRPGRRMDTFMSGFLNHLIIPMIFILMIFFEKDLGTSVLLLMVILAMLFVGGARMIYIFSTLLVAAPFLALAVLTHDYRIQRIKSFLNSLTDWSLRPILEWNPENPDSISYNIRESMISIGSGGREGWGLGNGTMKMFYLPETHTDFIMSSFSQEFGFIGSCAVFLLFTLLIMMGYRVAINCRDEFGRLLAFGITTLIGMQFLVNIGGVLGMLPMKGMTLPLISYGGSSLLATLAALGILINIQRRSGDLRNRMGDRI